MNTSPTVLWRCPPKTMLVGVDFEDGSARALALAGTVAAAFDARLIALHAERFEPPRYFTLEQIERLAAERRTAQTAAEDHLARFSAAASSHRVESRVVDEPPVDALLNAASAADLIVVGTHGRRGPGRWWLGSVAERIVRAATIPVLVTRAADTPARDAFEHIVLVRHGGDSDQMARACAEHLASISGGRVVDGGLVMQCKVGVMARATLVVMATGSDRPSWGITDPVAGVLGACQRPVLFIPAQ